LARSQAVELERLRSLLAAAVRHPGRRKPVAVAQLELPW
jgi:hypothetical protein